MLTKSKKDAICKGDIYFLEQKDADLFVEVLEVKDDIISYRFLHDILVLYMREDTFRDSTVFLASASYQEMKPLIGAIVKQREVKIPVKSKAQRKREAREILKEMLEKLESQDIRALVKTL